MSLKTRSNQQDAVKLAGKGIVAFEVNGVLARLTKKTSARALADADFGRAMNSMLQLGVNVMSHIHTRVSQRGELASANKGYEGRVRKRHKRSVRYAVEPAYAEMVPGDASPAISSKVWHRNAGVKGGTFKVTGGMWKGRQVRETMGGQGVQLDFRGSSPGGTGKAARGFKKVRDKETGKVTFKEVKRQESSRLNVRNQDKAGRIMYRQGVNVIQPTDEENLAMAAAVAAQHHITLQESLGEPPPDVDVIAGDPKLFRLLQSRWVR